MGERSNLGITLGTSKVENKELSVLDMLLYPIRYIQNADPRKVVATILFGYLVLGFTVLGFNRTPLQAIMTTIAAMTMELFLGRFFNKKWFFPFSAMITSFALSILLNYSHNMYVILIPVFFAIGSKYIFTFNNKHIFNPAQAAVSFSLIFATTLITSAPAYQWNGIEHIGVFIAGFGIFFLAPRVKRLPLVVSFLVFFTLQTIFRAWLMQHHLPFKTLFLGTVTSPAFFLFTFFMITDPMTSPSKTKDQIIIGFLLALFDLAFHLKQSYYTFFFAGLTVQSGRLIYLHLKAIKEEKDLVNYIKNKFFKSGYYQRPLVLGIIAIFSLSLYSNVISPRLTINNLALKFEEISPSHSGVNSINGKVLERVDPRVAHLAKWIMSVGDGVAVGDYNGDGLQDLFFTNILKTDADRNALYLNQGNFNFKRISLPMIAEKTKNIEKYGVPSNAMFVDFDGDQDLDLFVTYAFGSPIMLKNQLKETGSATFKEVTKEVGLDLYTNSISANFLDINKDGRLDLIIGNVWPKNLLDYPADRPQKLNLFNLPKAEYEGDRRMFNFMHASWHMADNGGVNDVFLQKEDGSFEKKDSAKMGLGDHFWTLAIATADLNKDGYTDLYVANDFGPDNLYYNMAGKGFKKIEGKIFGDIGKDTYKGMNASIADVDGNGWQDIYISNVHHELQAEGSLLWMFRETDKPHQPSIVDEATTKSALNEDRFGWGASIVDFNNDGLLDIAQANGMVDDRIDHAYKECPDFWYINEKIARSAPSIHRYVDSWGDIRGKCIYGKEMNRLYLNNGQSVNTFVDVAPNIGMEEKTNSRGMAAVDLNNDGKLDLIVTHQFQPSTIYKNNLDPNKGNKIPGSDDRNFVGFALRSNDKSCNSMALGSGVKISYLNNKGEKITQIREAQLVNGFEAQNDLRIHFGLAKHEGPIDVEVNWCGSKVVKYENVNVNKYHSLVF